MGKRIIQQARGKGSLVYRVRKKAYKYKIRYPNVKGKGKIIKLVNSAAHSSPLIKIKIQNKIFYNLAFKNAFEGQEIEIDGNAKEGNITKLQNLEIKTKIYNIESNPGDGGKLIRTAGSSGEISKKVGKKVVVLMPSKKEKEFHGNCRASVGEVAGSGRTDKPMIKAGKRFYLMKSKGRKWHRTSAVKMNAVDHPFGGGRGKRIKSKIAKRNAPPGRKVGHLRPRKTGKKKGRRR